MKSWSTFLTLGSSAIVLFFVLPEGLPRIVVYGVVTVTSVLVFAVGGQHSTAATRRSWLFFTAGLLLWIVGDAIGVGYTATGRVVPMVSAADAVYVMGHAAFIAGVLAIRDENGRVFQVEDVLESLIVAAGLGVTVWIFVIGGRVDALLDFSVFARFWPAVAYTVADGLLLALMFVLLLSKRARTLPFALSTVAFVAFAASGWVSYIVIGGVDYRDAPLVSAGWLVGYVLLTAASLYPARKLWTTPESPPIPQRHVDRTRLFGSSAASLMSPVVMAIQLWRGEPVDEWGWVVFATSVLVVVLVAARMACFLSELRAQSEALTVSATSDSVTGLANRRQLGVLLDRSIATAGADGVVVLVVDIDRFAQINETFGYAVGDQVLREIGQRLVAAATSDSVVGLLGGDQFVVSMAASRMIVSPTECADHFRSAVCQPMFVRDINVALDATVGVVASSKLDSVSPDALLQHAHVALTTAKHGHARTRMYTPSMDRDQHEQMRLLGEMETALRERQLRVYFQPALDLKSGTVSGSEALLRWQHPREGLISPWSFLPDAERTGMLPAITAYVLEDALACCSEMRRTRPNFRMSVNLSVRNLLDPMLAENVALALQRHDVPATAIEFEVTETTAMTDPRRSVDSLVELRDLGVSVAIDDYGTGYSSLAYLRSLPVQTLKIDKSFVTAMNSQPTNASIVRSTIDLARNLGMCSVAEGVEDEETLVELRALGCDGAQGFHIGRPVPFEELGLILDRIEERMSPKAPTNRQWDGRDAAEVVGSVSRQN
ncbi:bifunctional diguanylate cyclase/phosphodiesterase [Rhodococcus sp. G-MC3]|uniref:putative bifunctional diguanylate cyclase/phosphodiesterase n=1 Tax=Rhodococcus sp. G-MC3 TaxID=3046209 RepID=UPI0024B97740|nr:bifunctional diguanylate cyclase/phosphodiesterase [Rhodococcus sp. G-MC3]MDJ0393420.1 bifunctional diguanylate cyclase/phosphodiesterase [Rhodococcus sp. G-MC3]